MSRRIVMLAVASLGATVAIAAARPSPLKKSKLEGTFVYVGDTKGQAMLDNGRYVFLYGPSTGAAMTGDAGTYTISHDTVYATNLYSTTASRVGQKYHWTVTAWAGDTASYTLWNPDGSTGHGRATRLHKHDSDD